MKEKSLRLALLVGAMLGMLILAFVFDILLQALVERNSSQGGLDQLLVWLFPLLQLLWMVGAVGLVWWMISGGGFSRWVSVIYMVVGLVVLYSTSFLFVLTLPESFYGIIQYLSPWYIPVPGQRGGSGDRPFQPGDVEASHAGRGQRRK